MSSESKESFAQALQNRGILRAWQDLSEDGRLIDQTRVQIVTAWGTSGEVDLLSSSIKLKRGKEPEVPKEPWVKKVHEKDLPIEVESLLDGAVNRRFPPKSGEGPQDLDEPMLIATTHNNIVVDVTSVFGLTLSTLEILGALRMLQGILDGQSRLGRKEAELRNKLEGENPFFNSTPHVMLRSTAEGAVRKIHQSLSVLPVTRFVPLKVRLEAIRA